MYLKIEALTIVINVAGHTIELNISFFYAYLFNIRLCKLLNTEKKFQCNASNRF